MLSASYLLLLPMLLNCDDTLAFITRSRAANFAMADEGQKKMMAEKNLAFITRSQKATNTAGLYPPGMSDGDSLDSIFGDNLAKVDTEQTKSGGEKNAGLKFLTRSKLAKDAVKSMNGVLAITQFGSGESLENVFGVMNTEKVSANDVIWGQKAKDPTLKALKGLATFTFEGYAYSEACKGYGSRLDAIFAGMFLIQGFCSKSSQRTDIKGFVREEQIKALLSSKVSNPFDPSTYENYYSIYSPPSALINSKCTGQENRILEYSVGIYAVCTDPKKVEKLVVEFPDVYGPKRKTSGFPSAPNSNKVKPEFYRVYLNNLIL